MTEDRDGLFASGHAAPGSFRFDAKVARVFDDMIRRSVPGYAATVAMSGWLAARFAQPGTACCDLGCSLGATLLACAEALREAGLDDVNLIGVDNSAAMLDRCRNRLEPELGHNGPTLMEADVREVALPPSSVVILNWTLQFLPPADRAPLLARIHAALLPGGALILSEKIIDSDPEAQQLAERLHADFKRTQGYSDLEIAAKRSAIEDVLIPETLAAQKERLLEVGFRPVLLWYRNLNFASLLALKP
ncbi:MAG: carboxy-S-adenosyl-L-methionine synthase CmoA [Gammaproteobacteria bacterium]|nr:carboxy-S-adenosyl-L-methionine synthase CmoA [Gammaproteobacteria bacterium]